MLGQNGAQNNFEQNQNAFPDELLVELTEEELAQFDAFFADVDMDQFLQQTTTDAQMAGAPAPDPAPEATSRATCVWCSGTNGQHEEECLELDTIRQQQQLQTPAHFQANTPLAAVPKQEPRDSVIDFQSPDYGVSPTPAPRDRYQGVGYGYYQPAPAYAPAAPQPALRDPWQQNDGRQYVQQHRGQDLGAGGYFPVSPFTAAAQDVKPESATTLGYGLQNSQDYVQAGFGMQQEPEQRQHPRYPGMADGGYTAAPPVNNGFQAQNRLDPKHLQQKRAAQHQQYASPQQFHGLPLVPTTAQTPQADPAGPTAQQPPPYRRLHPDVAAAQTHLFPPDQTDPLVSVAPEDDDAERILSNLHTHAANLYAALFHPPGPPPSTFSDEHKDYYTSHQTNAHTNILNHLTLDPAESEARILVLLNTLTSIHTAGVPSLVINRKTHRQGYMFEHHGVCSNRLRIVMEAIKQDKYVATDVLHGNGVEDLCRSPNRYLRRKQENSRVNAKKAMDKRDAEKAQAATGMRRKRSRVEEEGEDGGILKKRRGFGSESE